jgi:hypothetical protein
MKAPTSNPQTVPAESNDANELETPPVQIADNSNVRNLSELNIPRPQTNPTMKVQS